VSSVARSVPLLAVIAMHAAPALAHTKSESHSTWEISGSTVLLTLTVPEIEAKRLAKLDEATPSDDALGAYFAAHAAASAGDKDCAAADDPQPLSAANGYRRFELVFHCPDSKAIRVHFGAFFELVPTHVNFAQIRTADGEFIEQLITADHQSLDVSGAHAENMLQSAGFFDYIRLGIEHIFTGVDHQAFLLGLVLISRRLRDLAFVITGFTIGHSATLALAVTGIIRPDAEYIDALIGLTIALIGAENIVVASHRPRLVAIGTAALLFAMAVGRLAGFGGLPTLLLLGAGLFGANYLMISGHLHDAGRIRLLVTLIFGLIHGFGFASNLLEMRLPAGRLAELLVGFNLGVEIGQLALVLGLTGLIVGVGRLGLALPRPLVVDVAASCLVALGLFWFVSRGYA
jgi:HupE / UreJ protein